VLGFAKKNQTQLPKKELNIILNGTFYQWNNCLINKSVVPLIN